LAWGSWGHADTDSALKYPALSWLPCVICIQAAYPCKRKYGDSIFTTRDYREILQRKDIDAVIIATSDNWHARISIDAMNSGQGSVLLKSLWFKRSVTDFL